MSQIITVSEQNFCFQRITDWPKERLEYISAWKLAFGRDGYEDRIDWLIGSPLNRTYVLKNEKGSIVAAYSLIRNRAVYAGSIIDAAICNNVFCVPEYQGLNLFVRIGRLSLADSASSYAFAYGFPNPAAIAGHKRVGWKFLNHASNVAIRLPNKKKFPLVNSNYTSPVPVEQLTEEKRMNICKQLADISLTKALSAKNTLSISKSKDYIYWRFFQRPKTEDRTYYVLTSSGTNMLFSVYHPLAEINILEFQASNQEHESDLIKSLAHFAHINNLRAIKIFGCRDSGLALRIQNVLNDNKEEVCLDASSMIVNKLKRDDIDFEQFMLPCSMSYLDNDVY